jgi:hypothetical protein
MEVVRSLRGSAVAVEHRDVPQGAHADALLDVSADEQVARFAVETRSRAPYPGELRQLRPAWEESSKLGHPLLIVPFVSDALAVALRSEGWSWADTQGNYELRAPGLRLQQRRTFAAPAPKRKTLPRGAGSFAVIRALIRFRVDEVEEIGATALADQVGVSQPRASQVVHGLHDLGLVDIVGHGHWEPQREALLDRFLAEYPGPGGSELYFYGLDSPTDIAVHVNDAATSQQPLAVSADVGPDLIVSWRRPSIVILYADRPFDPVALGLVEAQSEHDANVIVRIPKDTSVFTRPPLTAELGGHEVVLADPAQQIWDLQHLGGTDRMEAAESLRAWLLARP